MITSNVTSSDLESFLSLVSSRAAGAADAQSPRHAQDPDRTSGTKHLARVFFSLCGAETNGVGSEIYFSVG